MTDPLDPLKRPPRGPPPQYLIYPLFTPWTPWTPSLKKNFEILGGLFDPPLKKKSGTSMGIICQDYNSYKELDPDLHCRKDRISLTQWAEVRANK